MSAIARKETFEKLILSTAYILLFLGILKSKLRGVADAGGSDTGGSDTGMRMMERLKTKAELLWIREAQSGGIKKEWREQYMMFLDDNGIWRCGGRLHNADLAYDVLHPILLPKDQPFTVLIVKRAHQSHALWH